MHTWQIPNSALLCWLLITLQTFASTVTLPLAAPFALRAEVHLAADRQGWVLHREGGELSFGSFQREVCTHVGKWQLSGFEYEFPLSPSSSTQRQCPFWMLSRLKAQHGDLG